MDYKIILDAYEGPLDLLLNLISKAKVDIYDIPINLITAQYVEYIYSMDELDLSIASEFILMAATLLEIKSKMLLPVEVVVLDEGEFDLDPREELVRRLIEYKKYKEAAEEFKIWENIESGTYYKPKEDFADYDYDYGDIQFDLNLLLKSLNRIIARRGISKEIMDIGEIHREEYSLKECIDDILSSLKFKDKINFEDLFSEDSSRNEIVAYFLSILELIRLQQISVFQDKINMDIIISSRSEVFIDG